LTDKTVNPSGEMCLRCTPSSRIVGLGEDGLGWMLALSAGLHQLAQTWDDQAVGERAVVVSLVRLVSFDGAMGIFDIV
jgi:hypothetical protein